MKKILIFIIILFSFSMKANAASNCSYKEQSEYNSKAANIKASYEIVEKEITNTLGDKYTDVTFKISFINVTDEFYIVVEDSYEKNSITYNSDDAKDEIITFDWKNIFEVTNFKIEIYTSSITKCPNEKIKTIYLTTPRFNEYSRRALCNDNEEFYLCQEYVTFSEVSDAKFDKEIKEFMNGEINNDGEKEEPVSDSFIDKVIDFLNNYKWFILSGIAIVVIAVLVVRRIRTKKKHRELGL